MQWPQTPFQGSVARLTQFMMWYISISWHGGKELYVWYVLPTMPSIQGPRWCWYSTEKCLPDSHLSFVYVVILSVSPFWRIGRQIGWPKLLKYCFQKSCQLSGKVVEGLDCMASKTKAKLDPQANFPRWRPPDLCADAGREAHQKICQFLIVETSSIFLNQVC